MDTASMDVERLKIQKYQLYLQVVSVLLSGFLVYTLISGKGKIQEVEEGNGHDEFNDYFSE